MWQLTQAETHLRNERTKSPTGAFGWLVSLNWLCFLVTSQLVLKMRRKSPIGAEISFYIIHPWSHASQITYQITRFDHVMLHERLYVIHMRLASLFGPCVFSSYPEWTVTVKVIPKRFGSIFDMAFLPYWNDSSGASCAYFHLKNSSLRNELTNNIFQSAALKTTEQISA